jgi:hypothetical protein
MFDQQQAGAKLATEPATDGPDPQFHTGPDEQAQFD